MGRYTIYHGKFPCHTCKKEVLTLRFYQEEKLLTWICVDGHLSEVSLNAKKKKADFKDE